MNERKFMLICPNCSDSNFKIDSGVCNICGWELIREAGLENFLTDNDRLGDLANQYIDNYENLAAGNLEKSNIDRRYLKNQALNMAKYLGNVKGLKVCDVGIGQGFLCDILINNGVESVAAVDLSRSYLKRFIGNPKITPYLANAESLPFKECFDLLVSTDVMEHVLNVGSFLYSVNRSLRMGGIAAIRVPFNEPLLNYSPHTGFSHSFGHLRSFDKKILTLYMREAGFSIEALNLDGYSTGTPQPYLYSTLARKNFYHKILRLMKPFIKQPGDETLWNSKVARLIMRPAEIVVIARKVKLIGIS